MTLKVQGKGSSNLQQYFMIMVFVLNINNNIYGVEGRLLKAVQSFYIDSRACVRVGNDVSKWFLVNVGLRQGCMMSPWLFDW